MIMVRDEVANIVFRLRECGFDPRRVGEDAWEARCPGHGGIENALSINRGELNQALLECRASQNCHRSRIIGPVGINNDDVCAQTPEWLIASLRRTEIKEPWVATAAAQEMIALCPTRAEAVPLSNDGSLPLGPKVDANDIVQGAVVPPIATAPEHPNAAGEALLDAGRRSEETRCVLLSRRYASVARTRSAAFPSCSA